MVFNVARNNKTFLGLNAKCLDIFVRFRVYRQIFIKVPNIKFHGNPSSGSRADTRGQAHMVNLIGAFRDYVNAPKKTIHKL
jgi:hypothetical protein